MTQALCSTREMPKEDWLSARNKGVGGSDAAVVCGLHPYKTTRELYHEKRGELEPEDLSANAAVHFGLILEDVIAQEYMRRTERKVQRCNFILQHPEHPFMLANLDRRIVGLDVSPLPPLECKTAGAFNTSEWGESGTDQVPVTYLLQVQHYLAVTGAPWSDLAVLIGGRDFRTYTIARDEELIDMLIEREAEFWRRVVEGDPPAMDFNHSSTDGLLKKLYPGTSGARVELSGEIMLVHKRRQAIQAGIKRLKDREEEAKRQIEEAIGDGALGVFPDGTGYSRKLTERKGYTVQASSYFQMRFVKNPK